MGFDPRQWTSVSQPSQRQRVTSNVQSLLVENDALRHEVRRLRAEVDRLRLLQVRENRHRSKQSSNDATEVSELRPSD
jgi:regulator of replication initiation timing